MSCRRTPPKDHCAASSCGQAGTTATSPGCWHFSEMRLPCPFHPLHGATLQILRRPKRGDGVVCVMDPGGRRLKIPVWMLLRESAEIVLAERPHLGKEGKRLACHVWRSEAGIADTALL